MKTNTTYGIYDFSDYAEEITGTDLFLINGGGPSCSGGAQVTGGCGGGSSVGDTGNGTSTCTTTAPTSCSGSSSATESPASVSSSTESTTPSSESLPPETPVNQPVSSGVPSCGGGSQTNLDPYNKNTCEENSEVDIQAGNNEIVYEADNNSSLKNYRNNNEISNIYILPNDGVSINELLDREPDVRNFLIEITNDSQNYNIEAYERKALGKGKRGDKGALLIHSLYVITNKNTHELYTLSFNGTKISFESEGAWGLNTDKDVQSLRDYLYGTNSYDMSRLFIENNIDVEKTSTNIINSINSHITYYARDHINDKPNMENCNTALYSTVFFEFMNQRK